MAGKFQTTTKDVGLLWQLHQDDQLALKPEFQRNSVWPPRARAYLIDTILEGYPIPMLYLERSFSAQTRRLEYSVIDGQQRLSSVFSFMNNRFTLTASDTSKPWHRKRWKTLDPEHQEQILNYDFTVLELSGYRLQDIREMFKRINKYVVALNPQELRHSDQSGAFKDLVETLGKHDFWGDMGILTKGAIERMRSHELAAELLILLREGPQDKKASIDLYYEAYRENFPDGEALSKELLKYVSYVNLALPDFSSSKNLRKPAHFYSVLGAIKELEDDGELPAASDAGSRLEKFEENLAQNQVDQDPRSAAYLAAASRQTDNLRPRERRISILRSVISGE